MDSISPVLTRAENPTRTPQFDEEPPSFTAEVIVPNETRRRYDALLRRNQIITAIVVILLLLMLGLVLFVTIEIESLKNGCKDADHDKEIRDMIDRTEKGLETANNEILNHNDKIANINRTITDAMVQRLGVVFLFDIDSLLSNLTETKQISYSDFQEQTIGGVPMEARISVENDERDEPQMSVWFACTDEQASEPWPLNRNVAITILSKEHTQIMRHETDALNAWSCRDPLRWAEHPFKLWPPYSVLTLSLATLITNGTIHIGLSII